MIPTRYMRSVEEDDSNMDKMMFLKSAFETHESPIVIGDTDYTVLFMNEAAGKYYSKFGGKSIEGRSLRPFITDEWFSQLDMCMEWFKESVDNNTVFSSHKEEENHDVYVCAVRDDEKNLIGFCVRHICRTPESGKPYDID